MAALVAHQEPPDVFQLSEGPFHLSTLRVAWFAFHRLPELGGFLAYRSYNGIAAKITAYIPVTGSLEAHATWSSCSALLQN